MSLQFNDTTTYNGLVQEYEDMCGFATGDVSGNTARLKKFAAKTRTAWHEYISIAIQASGEWQFDDSNHSDYPIITTDIVSGQKDYSFVTDESGSLILDIYKVAVVDANGTFREIESVDQQSLNNNRENYDSFVRGQDESGTPNRYDKTANGIFLDPVPNYDYTDGLKIWINREPSYFVYTDTTKKPGCPGIHHKWFALLPAIDYTRDNDARRYTRLQVEYGNMKRAISQYFAKRNKDTRHRIISNVTNTR